MITDGVNMPKLIIICGGGGGGGGNLMPIHSSIFGNMGMDIDGH